MPPLLETGHWTVLLFDNRWVRVNAMVDVHAATPDAAIDKVIRNHVPMELRHKVGYGLAFDQSQAQRRRVEPDFDYRILPYIEEAEPVA